MAMSEVDYLNLGSKGGTISDNVISLNQSDYTDSGVSANDSVDKYLLYIGNSRDIYPGFLKITNNTIDPIGYVNTSSSLQYANYSILSNGNIGFKSIWSGMTSARIIAVKA